MKEQSNSNPAQTPRLDLPRDRRRFLKQALSGLAGIGLAGGVVGGALAAPILASPTGSDGGCTMSTVITRGPKTVTLKSRTGTYTRTADGGPATGGPVTLSFTGTLRGRGTNPWSATYTFTAPGSYTACDGTTTGSYTKPSMTKVVTWSKTSTTPCTATATTATKTQEGGLVLNLDDADLDDFGGYVELA